MKVELIPTPKEINDEFIKQYLADCSSVVRNAQPKDNERLFQRLLKESFGGRASRVFEFIPCRIHGATEYPSQLKQVFGFFDWENETYCTNARELLNWGWAWEDVLDRIDFTHYRALKVTAPYFIYGQASTHTQITSVSHSNRYTEAGLGYWMPDEIVSYWEERGIWFDTEYPKDKLQEQWNRIVDNYSPKQLQEYMKNKGVVRREIYARGSDMLEYRVYTLGGYINNPNGWEHFINQRLHDKHTQKEMRDVAGMIDAAISNH